MLCPSCHTHNRESARFCKGCGQPLAVEVVAGQLDVDTKREEDGSSIEDSKNANTATVDSQGVASPSAPASLSTEQSPAPSHLKDVSTPPTTDEDASLSPTQILTPERMHAYHTRRWQQELEEEKHEQTASAAGDIAEAPTLLLRPNASSADDPAVSTDSGSGQADNATDVSGQRSGLEGHVESEQQVSRGAIADMPTIVTHSRTDDIGTGAPPASEQEAQEVQKSAEPIPGTKDVPVAADSAEEEDLESNREANHIPVQEEQAQATPQPSLATPATTSDEEQQSPSVSEPAGDESFPLLAVGTTKVDRYTVTQVLNVDEQEHTYEVTDTKGYLHCWNCSSEQNAEGDEFCIDCGAELLNVAYLLHEYPQSGSQANDAQVLQGTIVNTFVDEGKTYAVEQPQAVQSSFPNGVHLLAATDSDAGTVRRADINEDSTLALLLERVHESLSAPVGLFVVADGMGGHANGQGASRATIALIAERVVRDLVLAPFDVEKGGTAAPSYDDEQIKEILRSAIEEANSSLCQMNQREKSDAGSTLTGFMMVGDRAFIFNVGDSRTYMLRDEKLYQLTNDHSLVGQLVAGGLIEPEDVYTHPQRNQIFRSIGDKQNVQVDLFTQQVHSGDILISCSDGLWEMVRDPQIADILNQAPDPQSACSQLIEAANANGGEDNVSAVIVFVR